VGKKKEDKTATCMNAGGGASNYSPVFKQCPMGSLHFSPLILGCGRSEVLERPLLVVPLGEVGVGTELAFERAHSAGVTTIIILISAHRIVLRSD
jgi:hypothetical protein